jgi:hypothetical protein
MPIVAQNILVNGLAASQSSYTTASVTPVAGKLYLLSVQHTIAAGAPNTATVTGAGMTWVQVATVITAGLTQRLTMYRAMSGSPGSGSLTIDTAGQNQDRMQWVLDELSNTDLAGADGSGAVVQSVTGTWNSTNTGQSLTLSSFGSSDNATYGVLRKNQSTGITPGSGFTELADSGTFIVSSEIQSQWKNTPDTSVDWSWASESNSGVMIAAEIRANQSTGIIFSSS